MYIGDSYIDGLIAEDIPYIDLTTAALGIGDVPASIEYYTREDCILCGTEEATRIAAKLGLSVEMSLPSGSALDEGHAFFRAKGTAGEVHAAWKITLNVFDHTSAIATKTRAMVDAVHAVDPHVEVLTTRKSMPGTKPLVTHAIMCGGAWPHRLGLSETILVFDHHIALMGGIDAFIAALPEIRSRVCEKKLFVECGEESAIILAQAGVDGLQFDKIPVERLRALVTRIRDIDERITLIAAGGIGPENAAEYAGTGVDGLATTSLFTAKPLDMSVRIARR